MAEIFNLFKKKKDGSENEDVQDQLAAQSQGQGKLIVIEGNDGSGKKTQVEMLAKKLSATRQVEIADFPVYDSFYGKLIARYLKGEFGAKANPYLIAVLYANDRLLKRDEIRRWLSEGKIVVCNRYVASNKAYQSVRLGSVEEMQQFVKWVDEMEYDTNKLPRPDVTLYLYIPSDIALGLVQQRAIQSASETDIHERQAYMKKVEQVYLAMSKNKNWLKIDCMENSELLTKDEIHEKIYELVKNLI